jgi:hypothetical protein
MEAVLNLLAMIIPHGRDPKGIVGPPGVRIADCGLSDCGLQIADCGFERTPDFVSRGSNFPNV